MNTTKGRRHTIATILVTTVGALSLALGSASIATADSPQVHADAYAECLNAGFSAKACCAKTGGIYSLTIDPKKGTIEYCFWSVDKPNSPGQTRTAGGPLPTDANHL